MIVAKQCTHAGADLVDTVYVLQIEVAYSIEHLRKSWVRQSEGVKTISHSKNKRGDVQ
jgi:hypothetical protein